MQPAPTTETEVFLAIFAYIDRLFAIVRPRKLLYMAIGASPFPSLSRLPRENQELNIQLVANCTQRPCGCHHSCHSCGLSWNQHGT